MKCEAYRPGCTNDAEHKVRGYWLCLPCARSFVGYTPRVTTRQALESYAAAVRVWSSDPATLAAARDAALDAGASLEDLNAVVATKIKREPAP